MCTEVEYLLLLVTFGSKLNREKRYEIKRTWDSFSGYESRTIRPKEYMAVSNS